MNFDKVYYEPAALQYELGRLLREKYGHLPWFCQKAFCNPIPNSWNIEGQTFVRESQSPFCEAVHETRRFLIQLRV